MDTIRSFKPVINHYSKVLILGSMPSIKSLKNTKYYGNPRNHFWKIIYSLFNKDVEMEYNKKVQLILTNGIALWDVIGSCNRKGSLDSNIRNEKINDFQTFLTEYRNIKFIGFNGSKAFQLYEKYIGFNINKTIIYHKLPSTSPIPGKNIKSFQEKLERWSIIKDYL